MRLGKRILVILICLMFTQEVFADKMYEYFRKKLVSKNIEERLEVVPLIKNFFLEKVYGEKWRLYLPLFRFALSDVNGTVRYRASSALTAIGKKYPEKIEKYLIALLKDRRAKVRYCAVEIIGNLRFEKGFEPLIHAMYRDKDRYVRGGAAASIGLIDLAKGKKDLLKVVFNKHEHRYPRICAILALKNVWKKNFPQLLKLLEVRNRYIQYAVVKMLGDLKDKRSVKSLLHFLSIKDEFLEKEVLLSLKKIASQNKDILPIISKNQKFKNKLKPVFEMVQKTTAQYESKKTTLQLDGPSLIFCHKPGNFTITMKTSKVFPMKNTLSYSIPESLDYISSEPAAHLYVKKKLLVWKFKLLKSRKIKIIFRTKKAGRFISKARLKTSDWERTARGRFQIICCGPGIYVSSYDTEDPVEVGKETTYVIEVRNEGTSPFTNVRCINSVSKYLKFLAAEGPVFHKNIQNKIYFDPVPILLPGEKIIYKIVCEALEEGSARNIVEVTADQFERRILEEEGTSVYK